MVWQRLFPSIHFEHPGSTSIVRDSISSMMENRICQCAVKLWSCLKLLLPSRPCSVLHLFLAFFSWTMKWKRLLEGKHSFLPAQKKQRPRLHRICDNAPKTWDWISRVGQTKTSMRCIWCYGRQRFAHSEGTWDYVEGKIELLQLMRARVTTKWVRSVMGGDWPF